MDPLTCPYCGLAPEEDSEDLLAGAEELVLTEPVFTRCEYCYGVAVAMPPDAELRAATDLELARYRQTERPFRDRIRTLRSVPTTQHFSRRLGPPSKAQRLDRDVP